MCLMWLEDRVLLSIGPPNPSASAPLVLSTTVMNSAVPINLGAVTPGEIGVGDAEVFAVEPTANGRLIVQTLADVGSLELRLSLYDGAGNLLLQSDGQSDGRQGPSIDQHIAAGTAYIEVQGLFGAGSFSLETSLVTSSDPGQTLPVPIEYQQYDLAPFAVGDFTNNGILDIVGLDGVHLGTGDGTFQTPGPNAGLDVPYQPVGTEQSTQPTAIAVGDFNKDGNLDAAVVDAGTDSVLIFEGDGKGDLTLATTIGLPTGGGEDAIVAGDFLGNGQTDLAVVNNFTNSVSIILNRGNYNFDVLDPIAVGQSPDAITAGVFENDGRLDLAVADYGSSDVTILSNQGGGNFVAGSPIPLPAGTSFPASPVAITAGNFGTGNVDLAVVDSSNNQVDILEGDGTGNFTASSPLTVGSSPGAIVTGDFGNGMDDLAVANTGSNNVSILMATGGGKFQSAGNYAAGAAPAAIAAGDLNGDGRVDLVTSNWGSSDISVLIGKGNGSFEESSVANAVGSSPTSQATGDFTGNGNLGVAILNSVSDNITILPGNGDGTFEQSLTVALPAGGAPSAIVAGDFNGDGRTDLAVADPGLNEIDILLGNGNGTFDLASTIADPGGPVALATGDFTDNGRIDIAVADFGTGTVTILLNTGGGQFAALSPFAVDPDGLTNSRPSSIVAGNFGNGSVDLAVGDQATDSIIVLMGNGTGNFQPQAPIALGGVFSASLKLVAGDFLKNGRDDIAAADYEPFSGSNIDVLLSNPDGSFQNPVAIATSSAPVAITAGDFTGNGILDLATADGANNVSFTGTLTAGSAVITDVSNTTGLFVGQTVSGAGIASGSTIVSIDDVNGVVTLSENAAVSGSPNLIAEDGYSILLGDGHGNFQSPIYYGISSVSATTSVVSIVSGDFTGTGRTDLAMSLNLPDDERVELSNNNGTFSDPSVVDLVRRETPVVADVNGDNTPDVSVVDAAGNILFRAGRAGEPGNFAPPVIVNPGDPSRDIAVLRTKFGETIASVDSNDNAISFFVLRSTGFVLVDKLATGAEPAQILAADLNGNQIADLIVRNAGDGTLSIFEGDGSGWFQSPVTVQVGLGASDIAVTDLNGDGLLDIVYTDRISGEVGTLENLGGGAFGSPVLYQAGPGPNGVSATGVTSPESSPEGTTGVAAGVFTPGGSISLVAVNPGSNTLGLLDGLGGDRLANATFTSTPESGIAVKAVDFAGNGLYGLAVLTGDGLEIYVPNGSGGFLPPVTYDVGFEPNGLAVADLNYDGKADLLVSNPQGDVQVLIGNGNGTFEPVQNLDRQVGLQVYAPSGTAPAAFIFTNQLTDQLVVRTASGVTTVLGDASTGLISPSAVLLANLGNSAFPSLIVANSGSNSILVFPGRADGTFGPALNGGYGFYTGTDPVGITVADVTGNGRPDIIVANEGSNTVSILLNVPDGNGGFTFAPGPVISVGVGPVSTAVAYLPGSTTPELFVANSGSNSVWELQSIGSGFFNDQSPTVFNVGVNPSSLFVGNFTSSTSLDLVTVNSGSNNLSLVAGLGSTSSFTQTISSGGVDPVAAFAVGSTGFGQDLVVANGGDGNIALFQPGENGLSLTSVIASSGLPNPSALALSSFSGGNLDFFAANEGESSASLLSFELEEGGAGSTFSAAETGGSAQLLSLNESSIALIGSLLTITLETTDDSAESSSAEVASAGPGGAGQSLAYLSSSRDESEQTEEGQAISPIDAQPELPWARYVMGLDQAIESLRASADARFLQESQPAKTIEPDTTLREQESLNEPAVTTSFATPAEWSTWLDSEDERVAAIDLTIGAWAESEGAVSESIFPVLPDKTLPRTPSPSTRAITVAERGNPFADPDAGQTQAVEVQVSRAVTLVAVSALAVTARDRLKRALSLVGAGSSPDREPPYSH
jgi:hypothetical protein